MKNRKRIITGSIILKLALVLGLLAITIIILLYTFSGLITSSKIDQSLHHFFLIIFIILVVIVFLIASLVIHQYLTPVKSLTEAVNEIGKGNLDHKVALKGHDEFSQLAGAFNSMTAELKKMIQAREQLLLDVSHELRTPITRSKLALEMLPDSKEKASVSEDLKEMELMITEILETARLNSSTLSLDLKSVFVREIIQKAITSFENEQERIKIYPVSDKLFIIVDEGRIVMVLRNIIENALKYSPAGNGPVEISVIDRQDSVNIQIEDSGEGIPEEKLPFVFEPFYRADDSRSKRTSGYGLGLHLCKRIMEAHGAEISIQNKRSGKGVLVALSFQAKAVSVKSR